MKFKFLTSEKCPSCGCNIVVNENVETEFGSMKIREHTNGGRWESRRFACGCEISYCPNFGREGIRKQCSLAPEIIEREKRKKEAKAIINTAIDNLDVDKDYKTRLKNAIQHI